VLDRIVERAYVRNDTLPNFRPNETNTGSDSYSTVRRISRFLTATSIVVKAERRAGDYRVFPKRLPKN
jgi:hypothetical protein